MGHCCWEGDYPDAYHLKTMDEDGKQFQKRRIMVQIVASQEPALFSSAFFLHQPGQQKKASIKILPHHGMWFGVHAMWFI